MHIPTNETVNRAPGEENLGGSYSEEHLTAASSELAAEATAGAGFNDDEHVTSVSFGESPGSFPQFTDVS